MSRSKANLVLDRRRLLAGAVASGFGLHGASGGGTLSATEVPLTRIQTPEISFVDGLRRQLDIFNSAQQTAGLYLSVVPAEPAAASLLNDARSGASVFSAAFAAAWAIPDLVRDGFIEPASPPPNLLPPALASLRSFGGEWVATDFFHDCDLLYARADLLPAGIEWPPADWSQLIELVESTKLPVAVPQNAAQQLVDHFCAVAASAVGTAEFWFDPDSMEPTIASAAHQRSLNDWNILARSTPESVRNGSTGDLWESLLTSETALLIASARFLPYALQRSIDLSSLLISQLPGSTDDAGVMHRIGNTTGANWGGVTMSDTPGSQDAAAFLDFVARSEAQYALLSDPANRAVPTGVDPVADTERLIAADWSQHPTSDWIEAVSLTFGNVHQLAPLRIAETRRYLRALERRMVSFLESENGSAASALEAAAEDWRAINEAIGIEIQSDLFLRSRMPAPAQ